jgi:hypothetical protein
VSDSYILPLGLAEANRFYYEEAISSIESKIENTKDLIKDLEDKLDQAREALDDLLLRRKPYLKEKDKCEKKLLVARIFSCLILNSDERIVVVVEEDFAVRIGILSGTGSNIRILLDLIDNTHYAAHHYQGTWRVRTNHSSDMSSWQRWIVIETDGETKETSHVQ